MGKLVTTDLASSGVKDTLNGYVQSYMDGTDEYSKYFESAPNFVTYFSVDSKASMADGTLGSVIESLGSESPLRFNKILDLPIYGVEEIVPQTEFDEDTGRREQVEGSAILLPGSIQPQPEDFFYFSYSQRDTTHLRIYRVTNVETSSFHEKTYYRISYEEPEGMDFARLDSQTIDTYDVLFKDVGSEKVAIIEDSKYKLMQVIADVLNDISEEYIDAFYDPTMNIFKANNENLGGLPLYDGALHNYVMENQTFINSRNFMSNYFVTDQFFSKRKEYRKSIYGSLERYIHSGDSKINYKYSVESFKDRSMNSIFGLYGGIWTKINWSGNSDSIFPEYDLNELLSDYEDSNSVHELSNKLAAFVVVYLKNKNEITIDQIKDLDTWVQDNIDDDKTIIENYILTPIVMTLMEDLFNSFTTDNALTYQDIN